MFSECGVPVSRHQEMMTCGYQDHPSHPPDYPQPGPILPGLTFISHLGLGFYPPVIGGILWGMKVTL